MDALIGNKQAVIAETQGALTPQAINTRVVTGQEIIALNEQRYKALATYNELKQSDSRIIFSWGDHVYSKKDLIATVVGAVVFVLLMFMKFMIFKDRYLR